MSVRAALPTDLRAVSSFLEDAVASGEGVVGSVLPAEVAVGAMSGWRSLLAGLFGIGGGLRVHLDQQQGRLRAVALVYSGRRPEWVVLLLAALPGPEGSDAAFRLLSGIGTLAGQRGMQRLYGAVPDESGVPTRGSAWARETFFQAGFYSYTRETWYHAAAGSPSAPREEFSGRPAKGSDAHDLFRFYCATTPHSVQRAEQLTVEDFDVARRAGAFDPPHLVGGNPLVMRREPLLMVHNDARTRGFAVSFRGADRHPHVCKVRAAEGDVDLARELARVATKGLPAGRPIAMPVRSYEDHVARALTAEGFQAGATAMLFVKELAIRIEETALAPAVVR